MKYLFDIVMFKLKTTYVNLACAFSVCLTLERPRGGRGEGGWG